MSLPFLLLVPTIDPCGETPTCFTSGGCVQYRSIGGLLTGGGDTINMVAWVNSFDITTVPWGSYHQGNFSDPSQTTPPTTSDAGCAPGVCNPQNDLLCVGPPDEDGNCTTGPCDPLLVQRSQYLFLGPIAGYYVIAFGTSISAAPLEFRNCGEGGYWFALGCIYDTTGSTFPLIIDLPIPDNTLDDTILVQYYYLGIIQPGATIPGSGVLSAEITTLPDLSSLTPSNAGVAGFGASWAGSIGTPCDATPDDPFNDDAPA